MIRYCLTALTLLFCSQLFAQLQSYRLKHFKSEHYVGSSWQTMDSANYIYLDPGFESSTYVTTDWLVRGSETGGSICLDYTPGMVFFTLNVHRIGYNRFIRINQLADWQLNLESYQLVTPQPLGIQQISEYRKFSGNKVTELIRFFDMIGSPDYSQGKYYTYSAGGQLQKIKHYLNNPITGLWDKPDTMYETQYTYDAWGNLSKTTDLNSIPGADSVTLYSYDANKKLTHIQHMGLPFGPQPVVQDTLWVELYSYNAAGDKISEESWRRPYNSKDLARAVKTISTYDANHNLKEQIVYIGTASGWDTLGKRSMIYNSFGILTGLDFTRWNGTQWTDMSDPSPWKRSHKIRLEYEWPLTVNEVKEKNSLKLYPSPASDLIRIETDWKIALPFTATILDMQGHVVRQWNEPATKNYTRTIPLTELASGMHVIKLSNGEQQYSSQFSVIK